jgi:DNA-binding CsgD family transcriptional regulator
MVDVLAEGDSVRPPTGARHCRRFYGPPSRPTTPWTRGTTSNSVAAAISLTEHRHRAEVPDAFAEGDRAIAAAGEDRHHLAEAAIMANYLPAKQTLLLMATECSSQRTVSRGAIAQLHGCTPREARLAQLLAEGHGLRRAAQVMGITYGTARAYLKIAFQKTGSRTQAQLVGQVLGGESVSGLVVH